MIVRYWHPFQEVETLRRQLDRVFEDVSAVMEAAPTTWTPAVRLVETPDHYVLTMLLAGLAPEAIDVQVTRESVEIAGDRAKPESAEGDRVLHDDVPYGHFRRVINLPEAIQHESVEADFTHGVLTLTLPKVVEAQNKVVKISLGQRELPADATPVMEASETATETTNA